MHGQAASVKKENNVKPKKLLDRAQISRIKSANDKKSDSYPREV